MRSFLVFALASAGALGCTSPGDPILPDSGDRRFQAACDEPPPGPTTGGDSFEAIYAELLAADGVARCADMSCHGGASGQAGFSMGTDRAGAYQGMVDFGLIVPGPPVAGDAGSTPPSTVNFFYLTVAPRNGNPPRMPRDLCSAEGVPNRAFDDAELARIVSWGLRGAPNDSK